MICPACNSEFASQSEYCENCGAPAYLALAAQTLESAYCIYCGTRTEPGNESCRYCGLKKNFRISEIAIGNCSNCATLWRNNWQYCQICGVPRENGLIQAPAPISIMGQSERANRSQTPPPASFTTPMYIPTINQNIVEEAGDDTPLIDNIPTSGFPSPTWSESEVVERMFVAQTNGNKSSSYERETANITTYRDITSTNEPSSLGSIYDLQAYKNEDSLKVAKALAQSQNLNVPANSALAASDALAPVENSLSDLQISTTDFPQIVSKDASVALPDATTMTPPPAAPMIAPVTEKSKAATQASANAPITPVQTVKVINKPRGVAPAADKKLIRIILVLVTLILLFAALIVSGFRIRDLFSGYKKPSPSAQKIATKIIPVEMPANPPLAPEGMLYLPGGTFTMGTDNDSSTYESPAHLVTVQPFFMDKTEITNEQYAQFVKATNHAAPTHWVKGAFVKGEENFPVVNVSWTDARDYAAWAGKRLPKESEWEFAARSNTQGKYAWGNDWDSTLANTQESNNNHAVAVGSYPKAASPFGVLDLTGNVAEWIDGEVVSYKDQNILLNPGKITRGGSFANAHELATTIHRGYTTMDTQSPAIGFRCVQDVK